MAAPADLSTCERCRRPTPPSNRPEFAHWQVVKDETGKVIGMRCPNCQAEVEADER